MPFRLFKRRKSSFWDPGESPVVPGRRDKPDLAGRRAFFADHILVHTHVPKTAGSTLSHGLSGIVGAIHSMDLRMNRRVPLEEMADEDLADLSLLAGHFPYGIHTRFQRTPLYIAAVREPVARAVSRYRYLKGQEDIPDHQHVAGRGFEEAWDALREAHGPRFENAQARQLTATSGRHKLSEDDVWAQVEETYFLVIPQPEITRAIHSLRAAFGVPWARVPSHNISKGFEVDLSPEMRSRILDANRVDMELYARVSEDFDAHLDRACSYIASRCLVSES